MTIWPHRKSHVSWCKTSLPISGLAPAPADCLTEYDSQPWVGPILTDDHTSEREKEGLLQTIKRGRKEILMWYMSEKVWPLKESERAGKQKSHKGISKKFIKCIEHTKKIKITESSKCEVRKVWHLVFYIVKILHMHASNTCNRNAHTGKKTLLRPVLSALQGFSLDRGTFTKERCWKYITSEYSY